jgi:hypothetical protein
MENSAAVVFFEMNAKEETLYARSLLLRLRICYAVGISWLNISEAVAVTQCGKSQEAPSIMP